MTQIRSAPLPTDLAKTDKSQTWTGTQDFTSATVLGVSGPGGTSPDATTTSKGLVQLAGDLAGTAAAPTVPGLAAKVNTSALAAVATSGAYTDLTARPALATVATSGAYTDLTGRPALATVASSGNYTDLTGRPALATVATSGNYADLIGAPTNSPVYSAVKAADTSRTTNAYTADTDLTFANVPAGSYEFTAHLLVKQPGSTAVNLNFTVALSTGVLYGAAVGAGQNIATPASVSASGVTNLQLPAATATASAGVVSAVTVKGTITTLAAATISLNWQTSGSTASLAAGSALRLVKM